GREPLELRLRAGDVADDRGDGHDRVLQPLPDRRSTRREAVVNAAASRLARGFLSSYFVLMVLFLYLPLAVLVIFSFNNNNAPVLPLKGFTTHWYDEALNNPNLTDALKRSLALAAVNAVAATLLGVMAALALSARRLFGRGFVIALIMLPLVVPYVVLGVGMLIL